MPKTVLCLILATFIVASLPAFGDLQNVQVGGSIRIRGNYYVNTYVSRSSGNTAPNAISPSGWAGLRWPTAWLPFRPIGDIMGLAGLGSSNNIVGMYSWDRKGNDTKFIEQRTKLNVKADFTNDVSAFIELDSYDIWGEDFRSNNYITGFDARAASVDDVEVYQAYIEAKNMWGIPLTARIGRQELYFGSGWLVAPEETAAGFAGTSFDAFRLTYATDQLSVDAFAAKLFENGVVEEDGDVDFYGIYGSYKGFQGITLDTYWLWLRDARRLNDTNFPWFAEWIENWLNVDNYDVTNIHTVGLRGNGKMGALDLEAEIAYQWGNAGQAGILANPFVYGDHNASYGNWAGNLEVGYTFDMAYKPRVFLGGAYFGGNDKRDVSFGQWLNPFDKPKASVSFNRLFSNWEYSEFIENSDLSNAYVLRGGVAANATDTITVKALISYFATLDAFHPPAFVKLGNWRVPVAPNWPWWTKTNAKDLGIETELIATYKYSEDLSFEVGWAHLFTGDGLTEGNFSAGNGLMFNGGSGTSDADYLYFETKLAF